MPATPLSRRGEDRKQLIGLARGLGTVERDAARQCHGADGGVGA
jgi:hypothetical protein